MSMVANLLKVSLTAGGIYLGVTVLPSMPAVFQQLCLEMGWLS
ncbi:hypothetical protein [Vibrio sp.]